MPKIYILARDVLYMDIEEAHNGLTYVTICSDHVNFVHVIKCIFLVGSIFIGSRNKPC